MCNTCMCGKEPRGKHPHNHTLCLVETAFVLSQITYSYGPVRGPPHFLTTARSTWCWASEAHAVASWGDLGPNAPFAIYWVSELLKRLLSNLRDKKNGVSFLATAFILKVTEPNKETKHQLIGKFALYVSESEFLEVQLCPCRDGGLGPRGKVVTRLSLFAHPGAACEPQGSGKLSSRDT